MWSDQSGKLGAEQTRQGLLPSTVSQGHYLGYLYGVGTYDSGLGLYAQRCALEAAGIRISVDPEDAWTIDEFVSVLKSLASRDPDGMVLDLKLNYSGEWFTYAFSPLLQSAGGDLIDRGAAMTVVMFLVVLLLSLLQRRIARQEREVPWSS